MWKKPRWVKSGIHQLRLVVENPIIFRVLGYIQTVVGLGISEPSITIYNISKTLEKVAPATMINYVTL